MSETLAAPAPETPPAADPTQPPASLIPPASAAAGEAAPATAPAAADPAKPVEPAAPVVPEKYEFKAPEVDGKPVAVDADALTAFEGVAKEAGLTQAQFDAVTKIGVERINALAAAPYKAWADQQRAWQDEIKTDAEFGGDKLAPSLGLAAKAVDQFGGAALRQALEITGAGNNPAIVRAFIQVGKAMDDSAGFMTGKPAAGNRPKTHEEAAREMYGPSVYPSA